MPDLDKGSPAPTGGGGDQPAPTTEWHITPIGGIRRDGNWRPRARTVHLSLVGGMNLDLRNAQFDAPVIEVVKVSLVGGLRLRVPPGVRVEVSGFSLLGGRTIDLSAEGGVGAQTVRVKAWGLVGGEMITD